MPDEIPPPGVRCSFCFTHQDDVADIVVNYVTGAKVAICDTCIDRSYETVTKAPDGTRDQASRAPRCRGRPRKSPTSRGRSSTSIWMARNSTGGARKTASIVLLARSMRDSRSWTSSTTASWKRKKR